MLPDIERHFLCWVLYTSWTRFPFFYTGGFWAKTRNSHLLKQCCLDQAALHICATLTAWQWTGSAETSTGLTLLYTRFLSPNCRRFGTKLKWRPSLSETPLTGRGLLSLTRQKGICLPKLYFMFIHLFNVTYSPQLDFRIRLGNSSKDRAMCYGRKYLHLHCWCKYTLSQWNGHRWKKCFILRP